MGTRAHQTKAVERLLSWLQQREDQMAALLADLIAIPTENPPGRQYREFVEVLEKQTERLGVAIMRVQPPSRPRARGDLRDAPIPTPSAPVSFSAPLQTPASGRTHDRTPR